MEIYTLIFSLTIIVIYINKSMIINTRNSTWDRDILFKTFKNIK